MRRSNTMQRSIAFIMSFAIVLSLFPAKSAPVYAADFSPAKIVTIDAGDADTNPANTFKGYGLVSANNTSRLLLDYKDEHPKQYWEMMNLLFDQENGAGINDIKIEMGNDSNTSSGTEPATKRSESETANVRRGAGFVFAADAKTINPKIKVSILRWTQPNWVQPWSDGNTDPALPATIAAYERMYKWYKDTAIAIHDTYGYDLDYINPDRNETSTPNVNFIKWFANRMRSDAGFPNHDNIKIIASDENTSLNIPSRMLEDPELMNAIDVMAYHYNMATSANYLKVNAENQKEVWYSEGVAPQTLAKYRANSAQSFGGVASALDVAGRFIGMYTQGRRTHYMFQPAIGAYYTGAPYSSKSLIMATDPWSGYYAADVGVNTVMQFTQFAADNWMYIPNASAGVIGGRGNSEMDGNATDAEYNRLAFVSPDKQDFSVVMVNDSDRTANYQFNVKKNIGNAGGPVQVWETRGPDAGQTYDANWYQHISDLNAADNGDVYTYTLTVKPHSMVSLTSAVNNPNTGKARTPYERNKDIPVQKVLDVASSSNPAALYEDDFEYSDYAAEDGLSYIERRGGTPRYTADQGGAFEVVAGAGKNGSNGMQQLIFAGNKPGTWTTTPFSYTVLGDERWTNYEASADFKMDTDVAHTGENYVALGIRHKLNGSTADSESGYKLRVYSDGAWKLIRLKDTVASGTLASFDATKWHRFAVKGANQIITASIDGDIVARYTDSAGGAPLSGQVMMQTSLHQSVFDNLKVDAVNGYAPYVTERVDDLDSRMSYQDGTTSWNHNLAGGAGRLNRTISTAGANASFKLPFTGTGFNLVGDTGSAKVDVIVDNAIVTADAAISASSVNRTDTFAYRGLTEGPHSLQVIVKEGSLSIDAVDIVGPVYGTVSKAALIALVTEASGFDEGDYAAAGWNEFVRALAAAEAVLAHDQAEQAAVDAAYTALKNAADALQVKNVPVQVTSTYPAIVAAKVGEAAAGLPTTVKVTLADGTTNVDAAVNWTNNTSDRFTVPYSSVQVKGLIEGSNNLFITIHVEVVPKNLVYFLDFGVSGDVTPPHTTIKALFGDSLLNGKADQLSTGDTVWGHKTTGANYNLKALGGAVVTNDKSQTGVYGTNTRNTPIVYSLPLQAGDYTITSFHRDWWNNTNRTMDITVSYKDAAGNPVTETAKSGLIAGPDGVSVSYDFTLPVDGTVTYTINNTYSGNQASVICYLGVAKRITAPADSVKPVITLNGESSIQLLVGSAYNDPGATAADDVDGDLSSRIVTTITNGVNDGVTLDTSVAGTYTYHYNVSDNAGNAAEEVTRTVIVSEPASSIPAAALSGDALGYTGSKFNVKYGLTNVSADQGILAQDLTFTFDPNKVQFVSATSIKDGLEVVGLDSDTPGKVRLLVVSEGSSHAVTANGDLIEMEWKAVQASDDAGIELSQAQLGNAEGEETAIAAAAHHARIVNKPSGDLNGDGRFSIGDLGLAAAAYGRTSADPNWTMFQQVDLNDDGVIDILDLAAIARLILQ